MTSAAAVAFEGSRSAAIGDVQPNRWSYEMMQAALQRHWIDFMIDSDGNCHPEDYIRREEVAAAIGANPIDKELTMHSVY